MPDLSPLLFYNSNPPRWFPPTPMVLNTRPHLSLVFLANSKLLLTPLLGCHKLCTVKIELFILTYSFLYTSHQFCSTEQYIPIQKSFILFPLPWIYYNLIMFSYWQIQSNKNSASNYFYCLYKDPVEATVLSCLLQSPLHKATTQYNHPTALHWT